MALSIKTLGLLTKIMTKMPSVPCVQCLGPHTLSGAGTLVQTVRGPSIMASSWQIITPSTLVSLYVLTRTGSSLQRAPGQITMATCGTRPNLKSVLCHHLSSSTIMKRRVRSALIRVPQTVMCGGVTGIVRVVPKNCTLAMSQEATMATGAVGTTSFASTLSQPTSWAPLVTIGMEHCCMAQSMRREPVRLTLRQASMVKPPAPCVRCVVIRTLSGDDMSAPVIKGQSTRATSWQVITLTLDQASLCALMRRGRPRQRALGRIMTATCGTRPNIKLVLCLHPSSSTITKPRARSATRSTPRAHTFDGGTGIALMVRSNCTAATLQEPTTATHPVASTHFVSTLSQRI